MQIHFITSNKNKFEEIKAVIPEVEQLNVDLVEIQDVDPEVIIRHKLQEAFKHHSGPFIVEDTSLYLDSMNGLPGPLVKWFMKTIGNGGLHNLVNKLGNDKATAKTIIGYAKDKDSVQFYEGSIEGTIVSPRGDNRFGWDPIFQPDGYEKTFAEMEPQEKNKFSMRRLAVNKFKEQL